MATSIGDHSTSTSRPPSRLTYLLRMAWGGAACGFVAGTVLSAIGAYLIISLSNDFAIDFDRILISGAVVSAAGLIWGAYLGLTDKPV